LIDEFYSHGKLLLTGEYVVLDGATALAIPTAKGQSLTVSSVDGDQLLWTSLEEQGECWFEAVFSSELEVEATNDVAVAQSLQKMLKVACVLNPKFSSEIQGSLVTTKLEFPRDWGLGSSSTLLNNIAQWAEVDAFQLGNVSFGGSGYDIAAAQNDQPILYRRNENKPIISPITLEWNFTAQLFFVHLNIKQDSKEGIDRYQATLEDNGSIHTQISKISKAMVASKTLSAFTQLLNEHEGLISERVDLPTVKSRLFNDYPGAIKSLGAWGGDFILATGGVREHNYFRKKGFNTIIPFEEMMA